MNEFMRLIQNMASEQMAFAMVIVILAVVIACSILSMMFRWVLRSENDHGSQERRPSSVGVSRMSSPASPQKRLGMRPTKMYPFAGTRRAATLVEVRGRKAILQDPVLGRIVRPLYTLS